MHGLNEEPYTTDKIIAECSKNNLHSVKVIIYNHKKDFEDFGVLSFEMTKPLKGSKGGRPQKTYHLNEQIKACHTNSAQWSNNRILAISKRSC